jgi:hypothetical protein
MANAIYNKYKEALLGGESDIALDDGNLIVALLNTDNETYSSTDQFYGDLTLPANTIIASANLANVSVTNGVLDADDVDFGPITEQTSVEALLFYIDTGNTATSRLVAYMDTNVTGLPITPDGSNVEITWDTSGIFQL